MVCEVFLNFRGTHVGDNFPSYLYSELKKLRVFVFRDVKEFPIQEHMSQELGKNISAAKVTIPIFTKLSASCKNFLRQIALMQIHRQVIVPIFYDVEASDVEHQTGSYQLDVPDVNSSIVERWKGTLREVGALKGWELNKKDHWYQITLVKEMIVPAVLLELKKMIMDRHDYLLGMDHHCNEMMGLLNVRSNEVKIVGIYGVGGIGKTTTAKFIYNRLLTSFECHSFLGDMRETAQQCNGLVALQKKLLSDTVKWCPHISDVEGGMEVMKHVFRRKKLLLVLDDVSEISQFEYLVGKHDWFGSGSRIIITSKDMDVLNNIKVDAIYEPPLMNSEQSLQLFSIHAFRRKLPPPDYHSISTEVASTAAGLPLALEVMGSFLSLKEKKDWVDTLKKLKDISDDGVERKLRVFYEALTYEQRQIFLDIACLFIGMDKATAFYMWNDCIYRPEKEFVGLCLMSLVKVERDTNELRMHDHLRTLGRKIVCEEKSLGKRSRLWNHKEALYVLEGRRGTEKVEALSIRFELGSGKKPRFASKEFAKLKSLRYLRADGVELVGDFGGVFPCLRWLSWCDCSLNFKPTNFLLKNLVNLDLSDSGITEHWEGWNQIKMANKLKVLRLADCALRKTPNLSSYATLEILILRRCRNLVEIDRSIGDLKNLKELDISYTDIRKLPDEIRELHMLKVIGF